ncbi:MAG TPA: NAD(P)H-quinone oxidoreductase subunit D4, partial [Cyanobacteria bacterium UBA8553]|nr:NAD(P)H-quinone oxidoreductase subunit D4 [Cyanobacteria bacterium UBA8553]
GMQFQEYLPWIPQIGLTYKLAIDGLSFPLLALSSLLNLIVVFSSRLEIDRRGLKYALIFLVNAGVAGAFLAQNLLLFVLFYELVLIPLYLLIAIWGGSRREYAAMKFL